MLHLAFPTCEERTQSLDVDRARGEKIAFLRRIDVEIEQALRDPSGPRDSLQVLEPAIAYRALGAPEERPTCVRSGVFHVSDDVDAVERTIRRAHDHAWKPP